MGILSTFSHTISVPDGVGGMSLKDRLLADGVLVRGDNGAYYMSDEKIGVKCVLGNGDFSSADGNVISVFFDGPFDDEIDNQYKGAEFFSSLYPDTTFYSHASYFAGGSRKTAFSRYVTNGKTTDGAGKPCVDSVEIPSNWIKSADDNTANITAFSGASYSVKSQDIEPWGNQSWTSVYIRDNEPSSLKLIDDLACEVETYEQHLIDGEYGFYSGLDDNTL